MEEEVNNYIYEVPCEWDKRRNCDSLYIEKYEILRDREDVIEELTNENEKLKELVDIYQEEHITTFQEWKKDLKQFKKEHEFYEEAIKIIEEMIIKLKELSDKRVG